MRTNWQLQMRGHRISENDAAAATTGNCDFFHCSDATRKIGKRITDFTIFIACFFN